MYISNGWSVCGTCPKPSSVNYGYYGDWLATISQLICNYARDCLAGQGSPTYPWPINPPAHARQLFKGQQYNLAGHKQIIASWTRSVDGPARVPAVAVDTRPMEHPWSPPSRRTPLAPYTPALPVPWELIPHKKPDPFEPPPASDVAPSPPADRKRVLEMSQSRIRISSQPNTRRPPKRNEKEKKFQGSSGAARMIFGKLARAKEAATEIDDFIDNIFEALPKKRQKELKGRKTPQAKLKKVYDHFDEVDWEEAAKNWAKNYIEDKMMGRALREADRISDALGHKSRLGARDLAKQGGKAFSDIADQIIDSIWPG
nr:MAG: hypothetical protein [Microvirus sp.]